MARDPERFTELAGDRGLRGRHTLEPRQRHTPPASCELLAGRGKHIDSHPPCDVAGVVKIHPSVLRVPPAAPAAALLFEHALGRLDERSGRPRRGALRRGGRRRTGSLRLARAIFAGLGEGDERGGAEPEFAAPDADDDALDSASRSGWLDEQLEPVPVGVPSWRRGTDEGFLPPARPQLASVSQKTLVSS